MIEGARKLPVHHVTIRIPWHDDGWAGTVCKQPRENTHCLILPRIGTSKRDAHELGCAGRRFDELSESERPPCVDERSSFMAPFEMVRRKHHPYVESSPDTHGHFDETPLRLLPHSAACVPFRWMLRKEVEGDEESGTCGKANLLRLGYERRREPELKFKTSWVQDRENQLVMLDTFFGAMEPSTSLCFFYAKRTPLAEDPRRVIIGVGRVLSVGEPTEYTYKTQSPALRGVLWERCVGHSIRQGFLDGFLFPYADLLNASQRDPSVPLKSCVAFAPDDFVEQYSYSCELLPHDGAIASLVACAASFRRMRDILPGTHDQQIRWIDLELNRLWKARGAFPGIGSALCAFGLEHGNLIAYEIAAAQAAARKEWTENPWDFIDALFDNPSLLPSGIANTIGDNYRKKWKKLPATRRALLELLSRFALSVDQATLFYQDTERSKAGVSLADADLLENPYRMFEATRAQPNPIAFGTIDRGMFPDPAIREAFPIPRPTVLTDAIDSRRVRGVVVDILERAADEGHTHLPRSWVIQRVRDLAVEPGCPLDEDTLAVTEEFFPPLIASIPLGNGGAGLQLDSYVKTRDIIASGVRNRLRGARHTRQFDWKTLVDRGIGQPLPAEGAERELERSARTEKVAGIEEVYASRVSVLVGSAGTGKTTLLRVLCELDDVEAGGVLLLAPTGKARVRLEQQTGKRGAGKTIAQFLNALGRYDGLTGRYLTDSEGPKSRDHRTVIVDECSMLTEEQLAALFAALGSVERLVLVGDPRQLPPIGAGRPFVDIVDELAPQNVETIFPKVGRGYAELTITRRQKGEGRDDVLLAAHFSGRPLDAGADEVWDRVARSEAKRLRAVSWSNASDLQEKLIAELVRALRLSSQHDETGFELSIGGSLFGGSGKVFFWAARGDNVGAAAKAEDWQILSPVRSSLPGVDALNLTVRSTFRKRAFEMATPEMFYHRRIPKPMGTQGILWGDKVINVINSGRRRTYPKTENAYVANGDIGVVVGEYKTTTFRGLPENLDVEFATLPGVSFKFWASEFGGEDANPALELAYALTVHKTQGSQFRRTFVVLPNPCRMLSRELVYTALTRHEDEIVILHQGPLRDLRQFGREDASEIAQRMTNLFEDARPREVTSASEKRFLEERLIHRTERGELVRSKSEVIIADKLFARKVDYAYERSLTLPWGGERYPDFTIIDDDSGRIFYWEHLGLLVDAEYASRWTRKLADYRRAGIVPHDEGGGASGTLIISRDDGRGGLDASELAKLIDEVILGRS